MTVPTLDLPRHWTKLESGPPPSPGRTIYRKLPGPGGASATYVAWDGQKRKLLVVLDLTADAHLHLQDLEGMRCDFVRDEKIFELAAAITLQSSSGQSQFDAFITDVHDKFGGETRGTRRLQILNEVLTQWRQFFNRIPPEHLTEEEQRGLVNELHVLQTHVAPRLTWPKALQIWAGPQGGLHDFRQGSTALECKAYAPGRGAIRMSSHAQASLDGLSLLYLQAGRWSSGKGGDTLTEVVQKTFRACPHDLHPVLEDKLLAAGYTVHHDHHYTTPFEFEAETFYDLDASFPQSSSVPAVLRFTHLDLVLSHLAAWSCRPETALGGFA